MTNFLSWHDLEETKCFLWTSQRWPAKVSVLSPGPTTVETDAPHSLPQAQLLTGVSSRMWHHLKNSSISPAMWRMVGGDVSGQWWNVTSAGAGAGQDRAAAGVGRSWLRGNFWTQDMFNDFLFWVNPNSSALNPAINSNLYHPVSQFFFQVLLSFKTENFPISDRTYFGHLLYLALSPGIFQGTCRKPQSYPSM